jgi:Ca2+/Na+ antiporter
MQRPLIAMNFSLLLLSLFRIIKKERKINKILFVNMFSIYLFMC